MEFFLENGKSHGKVMEFIPCSLGFSPTVCGQFKGNSSNLRQVKLPDLTMGTSVIALSLVCYIMFEIDFLHGIDPGNVMENMGKVMKSMNKIPV